jgi:hypothetical protein
MRYGSYPHFSVIHRKQMSPTSERFSRPLTDLEVVDFAFQVQSHVSELLNKAWYDQSGLTLNIAWSTKTKLGAWASIAPSLESPERHEVVVTYELLHRVYAEAVDFAQFAMTPADGSNPSGMHLIPKRFALLEAAEFMFASGLTFVLFHEIAHINQQHGRLRAKYATKDVSQTDISEFESLHGDEPMRCDLAAIYHATEFAADFEALDWMSGSLRVLCEDEGLVDHAYLQCAIVSCIMVLFNGDQPLRLDPEPVGTHPYPLPRMDLWVKCYAERLQLLSRSKQLNVKSDEIFKRLSDASFWALIKWLHRSQLPHDPEYAGFIKGAIAHPNYDSYMRVVIDMWTREYELAREARKYGSALAVQYYTNEFRAKVGAVTNHESLGEHVRRSTEAATPDPVKSLVPSSAQEDRRA